jgi:hypothetical protein
MSIFQGELRMQCVLVLIGADQLDEAMKDDGRREYVWAALQSILVSSANISKFLWGSGRNKPKLEAERKPLRDLLAVDDSSALNSTDLRNDFEHFDERIEKWASGPASWAYAARIIGPSNFEAIGGEDTLPTPIAFGRFYTDTGIVKFWDNEIDLRAVVQAIRELYQRLQEQR